MIPSEHPRTISDPPLRTVASELMNKLGPKAALAAAKDAMKKSPRSRRFWMRVVRAIER
jgi:hypothetical protein